MGAPADPPAPAHSTSKIRYVFPSKQMRGNIGPRMTTDATCGETAPAEATGWRGSALPKGMRRGRDEPSLVWDTGKGLELEMVFVPPGEFLMGSAAAEAFEEERPQHPHPLAAGYFIGRTHVTVGQFDRFVSATGYRTEAETGGGAYTFDGEKIVKRAEFSWRNPGFPQHKGHPVVCVSWNDARAFCDWAGLDLPTEAEWEKAARGTDARRYPWGNDWDPNRANFCDSSCPLDVSWKDSAASDGYAYTSPVGCYAAGASPYGALDMAGNVWQWCDDWFEERAYDRYAAGDLAAPATGQNRVNRGGCWANAARDCRTSFRAWYPPENRNAFLGFRVAKRVG